MQKFELDVDPVWGGVERARWWEGGRKGEGGRVGERVGERVGRW